MTVLLALTLSTACILLAPRVVVKPKLHVRKELSAPHPPIGCVFFSSALASTTFTAAKPLPLFAPRFTTVPIMYDLEEVMHHSSWSQQSGDLETQGGHCVTFVRTGDDKWINYNDRSVSIVSADKVLTPDAHILMYTKRGMASNA